MALEESLAALKKSLVILKAMGAEAAAAALTYKMIDIVELMAAGTISKAELQAWGCAAILQQCIYEAFSRQMGKTSELAEQAARAIETAPKVSFDKYFAANQQIVEGTGFSTLFLKLA